MYNLYVNGELKGHNPKMGKLVQMVKNVIQVHKIQWLLNECHIDGWFYDGNSETNNYVKVIIKKD